MGIQDVVDWSVVDRDNIAHHPTGPQGEKAIRTSLSFRELQGAIARFIATQPSFKIIEIGDWDMTVTASVTIPHGLADLSVIRDVRVVIIADTGFMTSIDYASTTGQFDSGRWTADDTNVTLSRMQGRAFDNTSYNQTSFNRGWITIGYAA